MKEQSYFEIIDNVNDTWDEIKKIPNYDEVAGVLLFKKIFELAPAALNMFSFAKRHDTDSEELYTNQIFLRHARGVVNMLDTALSMLGPDLDPLQQALRSLGANHVGYGVLPAHYPIVGEALLLTLEAALGSKWNDKVKLGWSGIFGIVSTSMLEGANNLIEQQKRARELKEKEQAKKVKEEQQKVLIKAYTAKPLRPAPAVGSSDVDHVRETWETIKKIPNYADVAGSILFKRIFELAPGALKMYGFASGLDTTSEELYKHPLFLRHARGVVKMLDTAIDLLGNVEPLLKALRDLGARHIEYGVLPAHYPIVGDALLYTLEAALGDKWNEKVKAGWARIYGSVSTGMLEGANRRIEEEKRVREANEKKEAKKVQKKATMKAYQKEVVPLPPGVAPPEVNHVKVTWEAIKEIPNYTDVAGVILFRKIFELAPAALQMFSFAQSFSPDSEELYKNPLFLQHARGVVGMLDTAVKMLGADMNPLKKALQELGARHIEYGVMPAHYPIIGQALLYTLQTALGAKWIPAVEQGWTGIYGVVSSCMLEGAHERIQMEKNARIKNEREAQGKRVTIASDAPRRRDCRMTKKAADIRGSVRKLRLARKRAAKATEAPQQNPAPPTADDDKIDQIVGDALSISTGSLENSMDSLSMDNAANGRDKPAAFQKSSTTLSTSSTMPLHVDEERISYATMVEEVNNSWDKIKEIPNYAEVAGVLLFRKIFELAPAAKGLFEFTTGYDGSNEEELYQNPSFLRHAKSVVRMLDAAVNMLGPDLHPVTEQLEKLGMRHLTYGVIPAHYDIVGKALLHTLEAALGDSWNVTVREGWTGIFFFISTTMIRGTNDVMEQQVKVEQESSAVPALVVNQ